jgi:tetratricopeptide (TPR) repeat protein
METSQFIQYGLLTYKLSRFAYRRYLRPGLRATRRFISRSYRRYYAWRHRPPTPQETIQAETQMRLAYAHISEYYGKSDTLHLLNVNIYLVRATKALDRARRLDPNAKIIVKGVTVDELEYTQDAMAGELLYLEARAYYQEALDFIGGPHGLLAPIGALNKLSHRMKHMNHASKCIQKALEYQPHSIYYRHQYIHILCRQGRLLKARKVYKEALALDPTNIETLRMKDVETF